ncbi:MAG: S8 family serine peptidase [Kofleriaceae bacterium]|nr:S8 family serine peptidase [Kofleriaceae bacterium]
MGRRRPHRRSGHPPRRLRHLLGVHVAGIAGARANNATGGAGVLELSARPAARDPVVQHRAQPDRDRLRRRAELAVAWAAGPDGGPRRAEVINFSLNHQTLTERHCHRSLFTGFRQQVERAIARGVVVVSSAGNLPTQNGVTAPRVPATCPGVIAVIASARPARSRRTGARAPALTWWRPAAAST